MMDERIPERHELSPADCWNLGDLFPSDDAFRAALQEARGYLAELAGYRGRLGESGETLAAYLQANDRLSADLDRLANYAQRRSDEDTRVAAYQEMTSQVMRLGVELQAASAFETPEILAIDDETLARFTTRRPSSGITGWRSIGCAAVARISSPSRRRPFWPRRAKWPRRPTRFSPCLTTRT